jgi:hypothetical protein
VILHKLLKSEFISESEYEGIRSLEFSEALHGLCALIKDKRVGSGRLDFMLDARKFLEKLNLLRNREWHRGAYILRYPALDRLVGEHVLPFVQKVTALPEYTGLSDFWKHKALSCSIEPIQEIIRAFQGGTYQLKKIAMLKELGRAAYHIPDPGYTIPIGFSSVERRRAEHLAQREQTQEHGVEVKKCPVCGFQSLVVYDTVDAKDQDPETGEFKDPYCYTYQVKCMSCTFEISNDLENPSKYCLPIEDYWHAEDL